MRFCVTVRLQSSSSAVQLPISTSHNCDTPLTLAGLPLRLPSSVQSPVHLLLLSLVLLLPSPLPQRGLGWMCALSFPREHHLLLQQSFVALSSLLPSVSPSQRAVRSTTQSRAVRGAKVRSRGKLGVGLESWPQGLVFTLPSRQAIQARQSSDGVHKLSAS